MSRESDVFHAVLQSHVFHHLHDTFYGTCFLFGCLVGFQFQNKARFQLSGFFQVLPQGGELLSVVQYDGGTLLCGGFLHIHSLESAVVVYYKLVVGGEPYIELGTVTIYGVGFHQCGNGILCRTVCFPEAAVSNDLGGLCLCIATSGK